MTASCAAPSWCGPVTVFEKDEALGEVASESAQKIRGILIANSLVATSSLGGPVPEPWTALGVGLYDDVIAHPDVDVVYVPLPNGMHERWSEAADQYVAIAVGSLADGSFDVLLREE